MANLKNLLQDLYTKANSYDALNELVGANGSKIASNVARLSTIDGQITSINNTLSSIRGIKYYDAQATYAVGDVIEVNGVLYKCITADAPAGTEVTNTTYFSQIGGNAQEMATVNAQIASIKSLTDHIQFEDLELDGVTYSLVTKKPDPEPEVQEPSEPSDQSEPSDPSKEHDPSEGE